MAQRLMGALWNKNNRSKMRETERRYRLRRKERESLDPVLKEKRLSRQRYYQKKNRPRSKDLVKENQKTKEYYAKKKMKVFDHYGHSCACCGETEPLFLTIDHVENDGASHRKTIKKGKNKPCFYKWLIDNGFPSGFQTLCHNCNCGEFRNKGVCPHKKKNTSQLRYVSEGSLV